VEQYALILNPYAGRGKARQIEEKIISLLKNEIGNFAYFKTKYRGHAEQIAAEIKDKFEVIIAGGGDGTVHEIVNGMMGGSATLAVLPIGSGNDFAKMLNLPKNLQKTVQVIKANRSKRIDIGKINDRLFPNGLGIGFDAWVVQESYKIKKLRGFFIYLYAVLKTALNYKNQKITITFDKQSEEKEIFMIAIGNGKAMGGGFYLTPNAMIDDGVFDVCVIHSLRKNEIFLNLPKVLFGKHIYMKQVNMLKCNELKIQSRDGIAVHADGELLGLNFKDIQVSIVPAALEVIYHPDEGVE